MTLAAILNLAIAIISLLSLGCVTLFGYVLNGVNREIKKQEENRTQDLKETKIEIKENREKLEVKIDNLSEECVKKTNHVLLCQNNTYKINKHFSEEMISLKDLMFSSFRNLEDTIKLNGNGNKKEK